jgi:hypothetical protein
MGHLELPIYQLDPVDHEADMGRGCRHRSGAHGKGFLSQDAKDRRGVQPADPVRVQQPLDRFLPQPDCIGRRRSQTPQCDPPRSGGIAAEVEHLRIIAPELFAQPVAEPVALLLQIFAHARPFPQFDDQRIIQRQAATGWSVGAQGTGQDLRITAIAAGPAPVLSVSQSQISARPPPPCKTERSPTGSPSISSRHSW